MQITTRALKLADAAIALAKISTNRADDIRMYDEALAVVREALAEQAEQEPVACYPCEIVEADFSKDELVIKMTGTEPYKVSAGTKYLCDAVPVRTKDLTDDEIVEIMKQPFNQREYLEQFARAVIAADREKNK